MTVSHLHLFPVLSVYFRMCCSTHDAVLLITDPVPAVRYKCADHGLLWWDEVQIDGGVAYLDSENRQVSLKCRVPVSHALN
jgi:hypothetical protein